MIHLSFALRRVLHLHTGICDFNADGLVCCIADRKGGLKPATVERREKIEKETGGLVRQVLVEMKVLSVCRLMCCCWVLTSAAACSAVGLFGMRGIRSARRSIASSTRTSCRPLKLKPYIVNVTCSESGGEEEGGISRNLRKTRFSILDARRQTNCGHTVCLQGKLCSVHPYKKLAEIH